MKLQPKTPLKRSRPSSFDDEEAYIETNDDCTCPDCHQTFLYHYMMKNHQFTHKVEEGREYDNEQYSSSKDQEDLEKNNLNEHTLEKPHKCDHCGACFSQKSYLTTHLLRHSDTKNYSCYKCDKKFKTPADRRNHLKVHFDIREFKCDLCNGEFKRLSNLIAHKKIHVGTKNFVCNECKAKFRNATHLSRHKTSDQCDEAFKTLDVLRAHKRRKHSSEKLHKCDICEYASSSKDDLSDHRHKHSNARPVKCDQCGKQFKASRDLRNHKRYVHATKKPHICDHCTMSFSRKHCLQAHMKMHELQKSYPIECDMQDCGTEIWSEGFVKCSIRCKTERDFQIHIQKNHTREGIASKLESERKLAQFFETENIPFERDFMNQIQFKFCSNTEGSRSSARLDFYLTEESVRLNAILTLENDEFQHVSYACDLQRTFNIANALQQVEQFKDVPFVHIRFNPHHFRRDGVLFNPPLEKGHQILLQTIQDLEPEDIQPGVNLIYIHYSQTNGELDIFQDEENDFAELFRDCVIRNI